MAADTDGGGPHGVRPADQVPVVRAGWLLPSGFIAFTKCEPCSLALARFVRFPEALAERHARAHAQPISDPVAFAKSVRDASAVAFSDRWSNADPWVG